MNSNEKVLTVGAVLLGALLIHKNKVNTRIDSCPDCQPRVSSDFTSPDYLKGHSEIPVYTTSTDDTGGTLHRGIGANYPVFTGGTFIRPWLLPPVRNTQIQAYGGYSRGRRDE